MIEAEFRRLDRPPSPLRIDCADISAAFPPEPVTPGELRNIVRHPSTTYEMQDAALGWVVRQAQEIGDRWIVAAIGMVLPGLCNRATGLAKCCPSRAVELQAEALDRRAGSGPPRAPDRPVSPPVWCGRGYRRAYRFVGRCITDASMCSPDRCGAACLPVGHPDFVLQRAVSEGVIDEHEAAIIGDTRLGGVRLTGLALVKGESYQALAKRRRRAERRLVGDGGGMRATSRRPGTAARYSVSPLAGALNREWRHAYEDRAGPAPRRWSADVRLSRFGRLVDILTVLEDPSNPPDRVEEVLRALVDHAAEGDRDAVRVIVQYLLPCLVRVSSLRSRAGGRSRGEVLADLLSAAWEVAATGVDVRGRPPRIALLRTIENQALRRQARVVQRRTEREVLVGDMEGERNTSLGLVAGLDGGSVSAQPCAGENALQLLVEASHSGLSRTDVQLLGGLSVGWSTCERLGAAEGISDRAVRYRRAAAVRRLVDLAA